MKLKLRMLVIFTVITSIIFISIYYFDFSNKALSFPESRVVQYIYSVKNTENYLQKNIKVPLMVPIPLTSFQRRERLVVSHSYTIKADSFGNQTLLVDVGNLSPFSSQEIKVRVALNMSEIANKLKTKDKNIYLNSDPLLNMGKDKLNMLADSFQGETEKEVVDKIYSFVKEHLAYSGYMKKERGALWALENKKGDCTEYASLAVSLLRINKIPARIVEGFVSPKNSTLKARDYHSWAEVYFDGKWHVVDALRENLFVSQSQYVAMTYYNPQHLDPGSEVTEKIELKMN